MAKYNWEEMNEDLLASGELFGSIAAIARELKIPYGTVLDAYKRGDLSSELLSPFTEQTEQLPLFEGMDSYEFTEDGNEATLKYKAAEPLTAEELMAMVGLDPNEWEIAGQKVGMWQMGRKDVQKDLTWVDGKIEHGFAVDSGKLSKVNLFRIEVKFTRIERIAVKPAFQPIQMEAGPFPDAGQRVHFNGTQVLFIADPHFGFRRRYGELIEMHDRWFLTALLAVARMVIPSHIVWSGDVLDLADWSRFETEPELLYNTQLAGIELAYVLAYFRKLCGEQVVLEGNHELRLEKALVRNMQAAFDLRPVHELDSYPLISVPRFLGLDKIDTKWIGGYPDNYYKVGNVKFVHGNIARKGSGRTASSLATDAAISQFFGHIHRYELVAKYCDDVAKNVWVGSPGCACRKAHVPGANESHNWQLGAFVIHIDDDGEVFAIEPVTSKNGRVLFRGVELDIPWSYFKDFMATLPAKYQRQFTR